MNRHSFAAQARRKGAASKEGREATKRERILEAAVRVFAERGFFTARVSDIARAANVADGTIYLYFASKEDLLISVFDDHMARIISRLKEALDSTDDPLEKIRRVIGLHLAMVEEDRALAEVLTVELRQSAKFMKGATHPRFREFMHLIVKTIEDGQRAGVVRADLAASVVGRALFGALDEVALAWLLRRKARSNTQNHKKHDSSSSDLQRTAHELGELFIAGLLRRTKP